MRSIHTVNVFEEIARLQERASALHKRHVAATIVKEQDVREVLVVMPAGANLHPHQPDESVVLHVLQGLVRVHMTHGAVLASVGMVLALDAGELHDVEAERDSAFLLVLPWPTRAARATKPKARWPSSAISTRPYASRFRRAIRLRGRQRMLDHRRATARAIFSRRDDIRHPQTQPSSI